MKKSALHIEQTGHGRDLFLIHGWMMNQHCWDTVARQFKDHYCLTMVDLPGHGGSLQSIYSLSRPEQLLDGLLEAAPKNAIWLGWSIGGLLAQLATQVAPERINALISVGMSSRYTATSDWPYGINHVLFRAVKQLFAISPKQAIVGLIEKQVLGSERQEYARAILKSLATMPWDKKELKSGLDFLTTADARLAMQAFNQPTLFIAGEKDLIVNNKSLKQSSLITAQGRYTEIPKSGHAPFLSHLKEFTEAVNNFCNEFN